MTVPPDVMTIMILYSFFAITGLIGNIWVLLTVSSQLLGWAAPARPSKPPIQSSAYIYLILLSAVDLISLMPVPMLIADLYEKVFPFGELLCKFIYVCEGANKTLSPLVLTALSIDRYIAICRPNLTWMRQTRFAIFVVIGCCVVSFFFILPIGILANLLEIKDDNGKLHVKCALPPNNIILDLLHTAVCYFAPLTIIVSVYLAILSKLFRHTRYSTVGRKTSISLSRVLKCSVMVVAFYFICWSPYWCLRIYYNIIELISILTLDRSSGSLNGTLFDELALNATSLEELATTVTSLVNATGGLNETASKSEDELFTDVFWMYILHAFPYMQSAFNWLFYAFLNRNLRNSGARCGNAVRSAPVTSTVIENGNSMSQGRSPLWKNIQQMGSQLKSAGMDTGHALLRMSPFRSRSAIQSRSSMCLDTTYCEQLMPSPAAPMSASMINIQRKSSLMPKSDIVSIKTLSFNDIPHTEIIEPRDPPSKLSDGSSVEWL